MSGTATTLSQIDIDVANAAILSAGARGQIARANEQSNEARYVRAFYMDTLRGLTRAAHWNFTRKFDYLTLLKSAPGTPTNTSAGTSSWQPQTQPPPPWLYSYVYPADCAKLRYVSPQVQNSAGVGGLPIFSVPSFVPVPIQRLRPQRFLEAIDDANANGDMKVILTNQYQAIACYSRLVTNSALWDAQFKLAFEAALAVRLAIPLSGDKKMMQTNAQLAESIVTKARVSDGNEGLELVMDTDVVPDWIAVRGFSGDWLSAQFFATPDAFSAMTI